MASATPRLPPGALAATIASAAMIAQQVAGKAARDALFLSNFHVVHLPWIMAGTAVLSLFAVLWLSRMIMRHSPARVVPAIFAANSLGLLAEWALSFPSPRLAAILVYLHTGLFGAAVISAFWSLINERFDPHSGKRAVSWIASGGTLGGVLGGLIAWRAAALIAVPTMLPVLAAINLVCVWGSLRLRRPETSSVRTGSVVDVVTGDAPSPLRVLRDAPYLRNLSLIVALGAVTSGLLDYVFSAEAAKAFTNGPALLSFFAFFWLVVGLFSFVLQLAFGRVALDKLGLAVTVALLPGVVVLGGAFGLAVPGLLSTSLLRGGEAVQRNSLFRAAYELLYTPLSEQKKRSTKTLIDVGFDRLGTVAASGVASLTIWLQPGRAGAILLAIAIMCALITMLRSGPLHTGYVGVLEESLRKEAKKIEPAPASERPTHERVAMRDEIIDHLDDLPRTKALVAMVGATDGAPAARDRDVRPSAAARDALDAALEAATALASHDAPRIRAVLGAGTPLTGPSVSFTILLLADPEVHVDAARALRKVAAKVTGQLVDALCDPEVAFDIRRRIPRVLAACPTQSAADGLLRGTEDPRFEVRYECGRALLRITEPGTSITIALPRIIELVQREAALSKEVWESQPEFDEDEDEPEALIDRLLRDRIDRSFEHVFTLLALHLDRVSLRIAFKALHEDDPHLRGTALEYLETVLPDEVRDVVWPFLGEDRPMRAARPAQEILADLTRQSELPRRHDARPRGDATKA